MDVDLEQEYKHESQKLDHIKQENDKLNLESTKMH